MPASANRIAPHEASRDCHQSSLPEYCSEISSDLGQRNAMKNSKKPETPHVPDDEVEADLPASPIDDEENHPSHRSANTTFEDIVLQRMSRRDVLRGVAASGALSLSGVALIANAEDAAARQATAINSASETLPSFNFPEVTAGVDAYHHVAEGYNSDVLIKWGDKVLEGAADFDPQKPSAATQAKQFGYNNDFIGYFPIDGRSDHGLLVVNHEYTNDELMYPSFDDALSRKEIIRSLPEHLVRASMQAHGGSVIEVKRTGEPWEVVSPSRFARRITAETEMKLSGPAAGHELLQTNADQTGTKVFGMLNNCAGGTTPWGTWLTCEENFNFYFEGEVAEKNSTVTPLGRYGIPMDKAYPWGRYETRFDTNQEPNEPNRFGWVVEIDPFDPNSTPIKRTALGRFKHEGAGSIVNFDDRYVIYQGDDERFEYVYKFVSRDSIDHATPGKNRDLLDHGTLYVAEFHDDGRGTWHALVQEDPRLAGFENQGEILIHARLAADLVGATDMDRPEDIEVNPATNKVYVLLTNNDKRTKSGKHGRNEANPRPNNEFGHIIEITPDNGDHAATTFTWEILIRCGDPEKTDVGATFNPRTSENGWFANPDNCVVDKYGRLWIATDGNSQLTTGRTDGLWGLETEGPARGAARLFFRCPRGAELCGPCFTPDLETAFVAVQHPGDSDDPNVMTTFETPACRWPDHQDGMPPRPGIVAITRKGGGKIAT